MALIGPPALCRRCKKTCRADNIVGCTDEVRRELRSLFSKNRERLLKQDVAHEFFHEIVAQARTAQLMSSEHFTVDGTLIEAWASLKSFKAKEEAQKKRNQRNRSRRDRGNRPKGGGARLPVCI